jgi:hypothetical protein
MTWRRTRGRILRLSRRRALAVVVGLALVIPAAWVEFSGKYDTWWISGLGLIAGATGAAILWIGIAGVKPDWIE